MSRGPFSLCLGCLRREKNPPIAERLKTHRLAAGLTQQQLADKVGCYLTEISGYETGRYAPHWRILSLLVQVLGVGLIADPPVRHDRARSTSTG